MLGLLLLQTLLSPAHLATTPPPSSFPPTRPVNTASGVRPTTPPPDAEGVFPEAKRTPTPTRYAATTSALIETNKPGAQPTTSDTILILKKGEEGSVDCDGYTGTMVWQKDEQYVEDFKSNTVPVNGSNSSNAGYYQCAVGNHTASTRVFIEGSDPLSSPLSNKTGVIHTKILTGSALLLEVKIDVVPIIMMNISATFKKVVNDETTKTEKSADILPSTRIKDGILTYEVKSAQWNRDNGFYTFKIQYGTAAHSLKFRVQILEAPKILNFAPLPDYVMVNETVTIGVQVTGHPTPVLKWYHQRCCLNDTLVDISEDISSEVSSGLYKIDGQTLVLSATENQEFLNGTYWFEVQQEMVENMTSPRTDYIIKGWGVDVETPNTTIFENMGEFKLSCLVNSTAKIGKYKLKIMLDGDVLTSIPNLSDSNETVIYRVDSISESFKGVYQCTVESEAVTLWSRELEVTFVSQPHFTVSPKEYQVVAGDTAMFSCHVTGVDPSLPVRFYVGNSPAVMEPVASSSDEEDLLYLENVTNTLFVGCDKEHGHPRPISQISNTKLVKQRLVDVKVSVSKTPYHKTGETLVIRCDVTSELLTGPPGWKIYWRHGGTTYTYLGSRGNVHMYDNGVVGNKTAHLLAIQNVHHKQHNGTYTCVFVSEEYGRYQEKIEIIVKQGLTKNMIALVLGGALIFITIVLLVVVVMYCRQKHRRSPQTAYDDVADCTVATNTLVRSEVSPAGDSDQQTTL